MYLVRSGLDVQHFIQNNFKCPQPTFAHARASGLGAPTAFRVLCRCGEERSANMDWYFGLRYATKATSGRVVDAVALMAVALIAFSIVALWTAGPFFALWSAGWTMIWWAFLPEGSTPNPGRRR